CQQNRNWPFAF
nr:immunoglobulin light chain junction region [Macaca mulatta]